jgi:hypothetical protein
MSRCRMLGCPLAAGSNGHEDNSASGHVHGSDVGVTSVATRDDVVASLSQLKPHPHEHRLFEPYFVHRHGANAYMLERLWSVNSASRKGDFS